MPFARFCEITKRVPSMILEILAVPEIPSPDTIMPTSSPAVEGTVTVVIPATVWLVEDSCWLRPSNWV